MRRMETPMHPAESTPPPRHRAPGGFTLIEVLLAMVLLSIGAIVLLTAASRCLAVIRTSKNFHSARHIFDLGELEYPIIVSAKEQKMYNVEVPPVEYPGGFTFSREESEDEDQKGLHVIATRVSWSYRNRESREETVRYLYYTNDWETAVVRTSTE